jgi:hypothetical protein
MRALRALLLLLPLLSIASGATLLSDATDDVANGGLLSLRPTLLCLEALLTLRADLSPLSAPNAVGNGTAPTPLLPALASSRFRCQTVGVQLRSFAKKHCPPTHRGHVLSKTTSSLSLLFSAHTSATARRLAPLPLPLHGRAPCLLRATTALVRELRSQLHTLRALFHAVVDPPPFPPSSSSAIGAALAAACADAADFDAVLRSAACFPRPD